MLCVFFLSRRFISGNRLRLRPSCIHVNTVTKVPITKITQKSIRWEAGCSMQKSGWRHIIMLIITFGKFCSVTNYLMMMIMMTTMTMTTAANEAI